MANDDAGSGSSSPQLQIRIDRTEALHFDDGSPVRAASALAVLGDGWLIAQDDAVHGAWMSDGRVAPLRLLPPVEGQDRFTKEAGTMGLKPDLEAGCEVTVDGRPGVLLLGSGSNERRTRVVLIVTGDGAPDITVADLAPLHEAVRRYLDVPTEDFNMEGACSLGDTLRWFLRGNSAAGITSASVDLDLAAVLRVICDGAEASDVEISNARRYELGDLSGVGLEITDAIGLPDGRVLVSAAAEDSSDAASDGEQMGSAMALLDDDGVVAVTPLPRADDGTPLKLEGLDLTGVPEDGGWNLLGVVDADDAATASLALRIHVNLA